MKIGDRIRQRRIELGWSQRELAARIKYKDHSTIAKIESGKVDLPQSKIIKFAEVLGVEVSSLMGWEEMQKNNDIMADIIVRMRMDKDFLSVVETLYKLDSEMLADAKKLLAILLK